MHYKKLYEQSQDKVNDLTYKLRRLEVMEKENMDLNAYRKANEARESIFADENRWLRKILQFVILDSEKLAQIEKQRLTFSNGRGY